MNLDKDYYTVLGVLPSVGHADLAAAYRALLKEYHPDVYAGPKSAAERITKEINEAYEVLGDASTRKSYDAKRAGARRERPRDHGLSPDEAFGASWRDIVERHPEAEQHRNELLVLSPSLAASYQAKLVETQDASSAARLAADLRAQFLERHFSADRAVQEFVVDALKENRRDVALEVNRTVRQFGPPVYTRNFLWRISRVTGWQSPRYAFRHRRGTPSSRIVGIVALVVLLMLAIIVARRH
jgi:curved DNA-binding protein CbpA